MPRGRHRHSPSPRRLLLFAIAGAAALGCAGTSWFVDDTLVARCLAAGAAVAALAAAACGRAWDVESDQEITDLRGQLATAEWRAEEKQAELETALESACEQRDGLRVTLSERRVELAGLRTEHAALLRRYANAETKRANALEGRRLLEIEASSPALALTVAAADHRNAAGAPTPLTYLQAAEALRHLKRNAARQAETAAAPADDAPAPPRLGPDGKPRDFDFFGNGDHAAAGARVPS